MAPASLRGLRLRRVLVLAVCVFGVAGLLRALDRPSRAGDREKKEPDKPAEAPKPASLQPVGANVAEMIKVINEKLEAGWKANNLTPARPCDDYEFIRRASLDIIGRIAKTEEID